MKLLDSFAMVLHAYLTYLIDDDVISLFLTERTLRLEGFRGPIIPFTDAQEALAYLLSRLVTEPPEFIFLDMNMPQMNGWEFLEALAPHTFALQGWCRIYLLTSSSTSVGTVKARGHALVQDIIPKPLDEYAIQAAMQERNRTLLTAVPGIGAHSSQVGPQHCERAVAPTRI